MAVMVFVAFIPSDNGSAAYAEIYLDGEIVRTVSLAEEQEFTLASDYNNTITVADGKIAVTASDCPGTDCVGCGWIGSSGRSVVCLPNGMEIRVIAQDGDVDFVVG
ncbi:MAG: NusG domain II-containing protein [Oscillospiraceae bacterium]|nr:NusG domain II-containing protein [Oscillospiraceae bacterium]